MRRALAAARVVALAIGLALLAASPADAHDCSSQSDCEQTTGYINGISVIGGIIAIVTGVLGGQLGGAIGGPVGGGATTLEPPPGGRPPRPEEPAMGTDGTQVVPVDFLGPLGPDQVRQGEAPPEGGIAGPPGYVEKPKPSDEPTVPWEEIIEATEPPAGTTPTTARPTRGEEEPWIEELLGGPPSEEGVDIGELLGGGIGPGEAPGVAEPSRDPIEELLGGPTGTGDDDPLAGEPSIDELVPIEQLLGPEKPEGTGPTETATGGTGTRPEAGTGGEPGERGEPGQTRPEQGEAGPGEAGPGEAGPGEAGPGEKTEGPVKAGGEASIPPSAGGDVGGKAEPGAKPERGEKGEAGEKPSDKVKPPILEYTEKGTEIAGAVKDAAEKVKGWGESLGENVGKAKDLVGGLGSSISDETRKKVSEGLDLIGEKAGHAKDIAEKVGGYADTAKEYGEKAAEYMNALNDNLEKTEKLGLTGKSQDMLGWWRVTFKAAGEVTEKFVDGLTKPVTKLLGEKVGGKVDDAIKAFVPVKEFGEELSKLPTSAAEHVVHAQQRDQVAENVNLVPKGDAGYVELDDLYPGRKWP